MQNSPNPYPLGFSPFYIPLVHGNLKSYGLPSICSKAVKFGFYCWNPFWATPPWSGPPCGWHFSTHKAGDRISHRYLLARRKQQWICERWSRAHPTFIMVSYPHHWHQVLIEQAWRWHFTKQTTEGNNFFTWRNYFSYICSRKKKGEDGASRSEVFIPAWGSIGLAVPRTIGSSWWSHLWALSVILEVKMEVPVAWTKDLQLLI